MERKRTLKLCSQGLTLNLKADTLELLLEKEKNLKPYADPRGLNTRTVKGEVHPDI